MLNCHAVAIEASDYLDRTAPRGRRVAVWAHLRICPNCRTYLRQLAQTIGLARRAATAPPPAEVEDELVALFAQRGHGIAD